MNNGRGLTVGDECTPSREERPVRISLCEGVPDDFVTEKVDEMSLYYLVPGEIIRLTDLQRHGNKRTIVAVVVSATNTKFNNRAVFVCSSDLDKLTPTIMSGGG